MSKFLKLFLLSLALAMCAVSAHSQSTVSGAISGTVSNPNKEVVAALL
jgi:hypothetical protein